MKKITLSLLVTLCLTSTGYTQVSLVPEAGLNLANMIMKNHIGTVSTRPKAGVAVGAIAEVPFGKRIFLQPGLYYLMNGASYTGTNNSLTVHTLQVPISLAYKTGTDGHNRFFIALGPYIGFNLGGHNKIGSSKLPLVVSSDTGVSNIKLLDIGASLSFGFILSNNISLRFRYQMGFTDMDPAADSRYIAKTSSFSGTVGYYLVKKNVKKGNNKRK
jgi:hypothetical protein